MSTRFLDALKTGRVILMDGAMGTELIARGLDVRKERAFDWNKTHPAEVTGVHEAYLAAGAQCLLTNSFLTPFDLFKGIDPYLAAARLAKSAGSGTHSVCFDFGAGLAAYVTAHKLLVDSEAVAGCEIRLAETIENFESLEESLRVVPRFPAMPFFASFSFIRRRGRLVTYGDDEPPEQIAALIHEYPGRLLGLGVNCGRDMGMDDIIEVVRRYRKVTDLPILARPNAGTPIRMGDRWVYPLSPSSMAAKLPELIEAGATLIGGCCGTTPAHIAAFREVIDKLGVGWKPN